MISWTKNKEGKDIILENSLIAFFFLFSPAKEDPLVMAAIKGIPVEAAKRGVFPEDILRERFLKVRVLHWPILRHKRQQKHLKIFIIIYCTFLKKFFFFTILLYSSSFSLKFLKILNVTREDWKIFIAPFRNFLSSRSFIIHIFTGSINRVNIYKYLSVSTLEIFYTLSSKSFLWGVLFFEEIFISVPFRIFLVS